MQSAHDDLAHKGFYAIQALITKRFWWPQMGRNIAWFVRTCHLCQIRQVQQVLLPPTVAIPAPLFAKMYMDTMHLPPSSGYKYIVQGRCSISHYPEFKALRSQTGLAIAKWIFEDVICRWGCLIEIVTDNGSRSYRHLNHYRSGTILTTSASQVIILGRMESLSDRTSMSDKDYSKPPMVSNRNGTRYYIRSFGPIALRPGDVWDAPHTMRRQERILYFRLIFLRRLTFYPHPNRLCLPPTWLWWAIALQKRSEDLYRLRTKYTKPEWRQQELLKLSILRRSETTTSRKDDLCWFATQKLNSPLIGKCDRRYNGPFVVVTRNRGGAYVICELDGTVLDRLITAFRLLPYFAREAIEIPYMGRFINIPYNGWRRWNKVKMMDRTVKKWKRMKSEKMKTMQRRLLSWMRLMATEDSQHFSREEDRPRYPIV
jgi:hypothetical protein